MSKTREQIRREKIQELKREAAKHSYTLIHEENKDSFFMRFKECKDGVIRPTGFELKVYGDLNNSDSVKHKVEEAILLGFKKMQRV